MAAKVSLIEMVKLNYKKRTDQGIRPFLSNALPLSVPYVVLVDPSSSCNLKCLFCPTGDIPLIKSTGRFQGLMTSETFDSVLKGIECFPEPIKVLRLYKEGEPLVNTKFISFVEKARVSKNILRIDTTTNGIALNPVLNQQLVDSGIDQINVSVNAMKEDNFFRLTKKRINMEKYTENLIDLCKRSKDTEIYIKSIKENLDDEERELFIDTFAPYADRIFFESLQPNWPEFNFNYIDIDLATGHYGQNAEQREVCPFIFYMMVVNADGSVSACVQDWQHNLIVGNVKTNSLKDIWAGAPLVSLQKSHLTLRRCDYRSCCNCPVLIHGSLDNIDDSRGLILTRMGI